MLLPKCRYFTDSHLSVVMEHYGEWLWAIYTWINVVIKLWKTLMYVHVFSLNFSTKYCKQVSWDMTPFLGE